MQSRFEAFRDATMESPLIFGSEKTTYMRKVQRHQKSLAEETAWLEKIQTEEQQSADDARLHQMRMNELVFAKKQLDIVIAFTMSASKLGVASSAFARSIATEMHRMTLSPVVKPSEILPNCMLLAHFKCGLEDSAHQEFWALCSVKELKSFALPKEQSVEGVLADIVGDKIAQYTKGAKGFADVKTLHAWLDMYDDAVPLPEPLHVQLQAVQHVVRKDRKGVRSQGVHVIKCHKFLAVRSLSILVARRWADPNSREI